MSDNKRIIRELGSSELRRVCDESLFGFETTQELDVLDGVIEQERAVKALRLGVAIEKRNYNIFVAGDSGTGRTTIVLSIVKEAAAKRPVPSDWVFVQNFRDKESPKAIRLPAGKGREFSAAMDQLVETLKEELPKEFRAREYQEEIQEIVSGSLAKEQEYFGNLSKKAAEIGFQVKSTKTGLITIPMAGEKALSNKEYEALSDEDKQGIEERRRVLEPMIHDFVARTRNIETDTQETLKRRQNRLAKRVCSAPVRRLKRRYGKYDGISEYLEHVLENILENVAKFVREESAQPQNPFMENPEREFSDYKVNVVVDNSELKAAPVIVETRPTYYNLFGKLEKKVENGVYFTDFTMVKAGSILRANGGYLLINTNDLFNYPMVWENLKSILRYRQLTIEDMGEHLGYLPTSGLKPEPIPIDLKIVLVGPASVYEMLHRYDEDFRKLFQVKSEFDYEMNWSDVTIQEYAKFIATTCKNERLRPATRDAVARVVEYGCRLVESQQKVTLQFNHICNLLIEADLLAGEAGSKVIAGGHVELAIQERQYRLGLFEEKLRAEILESTVFVDLSGAKVGTINGLAVYEVGDYSFGRPSRITSVVHAGKGGVINVEREARLSGKIHAKGVAILSGYLGALFGQRRSPSLTASVCFEQSYGPIDGDSASAAELFSILSSLSGVPIKQSFAVTGSVNQHGDIQPIGGVNEKVEAWFKLCAARGLTGEQGVVIPESNVKNLMLDKEVILAVERGQFRVIPISRVEQGIEILTGVECGAMLEDFTFGPEGSVLELAWRTMERFDEGEEGDDEVEDGKEQAPA